jgi:hypothetical protein
LTMLRISWILLKHSEDNLVPKVLQCLNSRDSLVSTSPPEAEVEHGLVVTSIMGSVRILMSVTVATNGICWFHGIWSRVFLAVSSYHGRCFSLDGNFNLKELLGGEDLELMRETVLSDDLRFSKVDANLCTVGSGLSKNIQKYGSRSHSQN